MTSRRLRLGARLQRCEYGTQKRPMVDPVCSSDSACVAGLRNRVVCLPLVDARLRDLKIFCEIRLAPPGPLTRWSQEVAGLNHSSAITENYADRKVRYN